jgi:hypothetical protein
MRFFEFSPLVVMNDHCMRQPKEMTIMRKEAFWVMPALLVFLFAGCGEGGAGEQQGPYLQGRSGAFAALEEKALAIADRQLLELADLPAMSAWASKAVVVARYPLYLPGITQPSYFECKVKVDGENAGYLLVNVDKKDVEVPEIMTEGLTLTETYRKELVGPGTKIIRLGWFDSLAVTTDGSDAVVAGYDFSRNEMVKEGDLLLDYTRIMDKVSLQLAADDASPVDSTESLEEERDGVDFENKNDDAWGTKRIRKRYRYISASLPEKNKFSYVNWYFPSWFQIHRTDDKNSDFVGCGAVAVAKVYAYWSVFMGKMSLYREIRLHDFGNVIPFSDALSGDFKNPMVVDRLWRIASELETYWTHSGQGLVTVSKMERNVDEYGDKFGYPDTYAKRVNGNEFRKAEKIMAELRLGKPVIMLIQSNGKGARDHWVVVAKTVIKERKRGRRGKWRQREVWHLVDMGAIGHGFKPFSLVKPMTKFICVRNKGLNGGVNVHRAGAAIFLDVR